MGQCRETLGRIPPPLELSRRWATAVGRNHPTVQPKGLRWAFPRGRDHLGWGCLPLGRGRSNDRALGLPDRRLAVDGGLDPSTFINGHRRGRRHHPAVQAVGSPGLGGLGVVGGRSIDLLPLVGGSDADNESARGGEGGDNCKKNKHCEPAHESLLRLRFQIYTVRLNFQLDCKEQTSIARFRAFVNPKG